ncbi:MAG: hypothetical protein CFE34_14680, partial [Rhodobacteraceae bacterium PARR1]
MSLSRALRRARNRATRRGMAETTRFETHDNAYRIETLEPRILMSADIALAALPGATTAVAAEVKFLETGGRRIEVYLDGSLKSTVTDLSGGVKITGTSGNDSIIVSFEEGFDDNALALSVSGGDGTDSVTLSSDDTGGATDLGSVSVTAEQIRVYSAIGARTGFGVTGDVTLTAASSVTGGTASVLIQQDLNMFGALVVSASAVHESTSGDASSATVSVQANLLAGSVDLSSKVSRNLTDGSLGLANYHFGDATATLTVADGVNILADDVSLSATVDGKVKMGPQSYIPGDISAAVQSIKFVVITAKDVATITLGNGQIKPSDPDYAINSTTGGTAIAANVATEYASAGILVSQKIEGSATVTATGTVIDGGLGGVSVTADVAQQIKAVGPAFVAETTPPTFPMAVAAFVFNEERVTTKVTLESVTINTTGDSTVAARNTSSVTAILAGQAQSAAESLAILSSLPQVAVAGMFATNEILSDVQTTLTDTTIVAGGDAAVVALNDMAITATVDGGAKSTSAAIGTSLAFNSIGWTPGNLFASALGVFLGNDTGSTPEPMVTRVTLENSSVWASGALEISATAVPVITAKVLNKAESTGDTLALGFVMAGNRIQSDVDVIIGKGGADELLTVEGGSVTIAGTDGATIESEASVSSASQGGPSLGGLLARNAVQSTVDVAIVATTVAATAGDMSTRSDTTATITATVSGLQPAAEEGTKPASFALNGVIATNMILADTNLTVTGGSMTASGDLTIGAANAGTITATNTAEATGKGTAIGVSLAFNTIGWQAQNFLFGTVDALIGTDIAAPTPSKAKVTLTNVAIQAGGNITVAAENTQTITARLKADATSAEAAGAGIMLALNKTTSVTRILLDGGYIRGTGDASDVTIRAVDASGVDAEVGLKVGGGTVAAGGLVARNDVRSDVDLTGTANEITTTGSADLSARAVAGITAKLDGTFEIVDDKSKDGLAFGGVIASNLILVDVATTFTNASMDAGGDLSILARSAGTITAENGVSVKGTGTAVGIMLAFNTVGWQAQNILFAMVDALIGTSIGAAQDAQAIVSLSGGSFSAGGNLALGAENAAEIAAKINSVATSAAAAGAGVILASNRVKSRSQVLVDDGTGSGGISAGGDLAITATDKAAITSEITMEAAGATTGVGMIFVRNDARGEVKAFVNEVNLTSTDGTVTVSAIGASSVEAKASGDVKIVSEDEGATGSAVAGLIASNMVLGGAEATIQFATVTAGAGIDVLADTLTLVRAENAMKAEASGTAVGLTLAFNSIGWDSSNIFQQMADALLATSIGASPGINTVARMWNVAFTAGGAVRVLAGGTDAEAERRGALIDAAIDASAAASGSSAGVGIVLTSNRVKTSATAEIDTDQANRARDVAGSIEVAARDTAAITGKTAMAAGSGGGAAVGLTIVLNDVQGNVSALIDSMTLQTQNDLTIAADQQSTINADLSGKVTSAPSEDAEDSNTLSFGGVIATNVVRSKASAKLLSSDVVVGGNMTVSALNNAEIIAVNAALQSAAGTGTAVGITLAFNTVGWEPQDLFRKSVDALLGTNIGVQDNATATALVQDSAMVVGGDLTVSADMTSKIYATVKNESRAGSAGSAASIILATNLIASDASAQLLQPVGDVLAGGVLSVVANDAPDILAKGTVIAVAKDDDKAGKEYIKVDHYSDQGETDIEFGDQVFVKEGHEAGGTIGHIYRFMGVDATVDLSATDFDDKRFWWEIPPPVGFMGEILGFLYKEMPLETKEFTLAKLPIGDQTHTFGLKVQAGWDDMTVLDFLSGMGVVEPGLNMNLADTLLKATSTADHKSDATAATLKKGETVEYVGTGLLKGKVFKYLGDDKVGAFNLSTVTD